MVLRITKLLLLVLCVHSGFATPACWSQTTRKKTPTIRLKEGDEVQLKRFNNWIDAIVLEVNGSQIAVEYQEDDGSFKRSVTTIQNLRFAWMAKALTPMRTWTDKSKKFRLRAAAVGLKEGYVLLHKEDGSEISVPVAKLSTTDQKFLERAQATAIPTLPELTEFAVNMNGSWAGGWNSSQNLSGLTADPAPSFSKIPMKGVGFTRFDFHEKLVLVHPIGGKDGWIVAATKTSFGKPSRLIWGALTEGRVKKIHMLPPGQQVVAVDAPSRQLVSRGADRETVLTLWQGDPTAANLSAKVSWKSSEKRGGGSLCEIVAPNRILHEWGRGKFICWDTDAQAEAYQIGQESFFRARPVLSPGKKYLATPEDTRCRVLDSATGETLATLPIEGGKCSGAAFNSTGDKLAILTRSQLAVWKLGSNEPPQKFDANSVGSPFARDLEWVDDNSLLVGRETLFDTRLELPVWQYKAKTFDVVSDSFGAKNRKLVGKMLCYAVEIRQPQDGFVVGAVELPGPKVRETVAALDKDSLYVINPGHRVGMRVNCGQYNQQVEQALMRQIKDNGWIYDASAATFLDAEMGRGKPQTTQYQSQGNRNGGSTSVTVTPYFSRLKLMHNGNIAFQANTGTGAPPVMFLLPGQSAQSKVEAMQQPDPKHFSRVDIPDRIFDPTKRGGLGTSVISSAGLVPQ